jgi:hypothetical protein
MGRYATDTPHNNCLVARRPFANEGAPVQQRLFELRGEATHYMVVVSASSTKWALKQGPDYPN